MRDLLTRSLPDAVRERMTAEDWRALSPLIYHHVNPYGRI